MLVHVLLISNSCSSSHIDISIYIDYGQHAVHAYFAPVMVLSDFRSPCIYIIYVAMDNWIYIRVIHVVLTKLLHFSVSRFYRCIANTD